MRTSGRESGARPPNQDAAHQVDDKGHQAPDVARARGQVVEPAQQHGRAQHSEREPAAGDNEGGASLPPIALNCRLHEEPRHREQPRNSDDQQAGLAVTEVQQQHDNLKTCNWGVTSVPTEFAPAGWRQCGTLALGCRLQ